MVMGQIEDIYDFGQDGGVLVVLLCLLSSDGPDMLNGADLARAG